VKEFTVTITNIASNCSGALLTSNFTIYVSFADPLVVTGFDTALEDCNDDVLIFPTISGGYGVYRYFWSTGSTAPELLVSPGFTTTYFLTVSDTCGAGSQQVSFNVQVPVYPPIVVDLGEDIIVNECDVTVDLIPSVAGGFGAYEYNWTSLTENLGNTPTLSYVVAQSTNITLTVTDDCDATGIDVVGIIVPPVNVTVFLPDIFEVSSCLEGFLMPAISEGGIGIITYTWYVDGVEQAVTQDVFFQYHASMGQTVMIHAEDECQNFAEDTTVVALNFPPVYIETSADTSICKQTGAELRVSASGGSGNFKFLWEDLGLTDTVIYVEPREFSSYRVTVTDTCGVRDEGLIRVDIRDVRADFEFDHIDYFGVQIRNRSTPVNSTSLWHFGDGASSTLTNPRHVYLDTQEFRIDLLVTDDAGCTDSTFRIVLPPVEVFIPNSFTPNADGINDLFDVVGSNISEFQMWIYDRWGREVFYTNNVDKKWNGSHNGGDYYATTSIYAYLIKFKGMREEDAIERTGTVTVIR
jgi:gliding motility-associated-like protein